MSRKLMYMPSHTSITLIQFTFSASKTCYYFSTTVEPEQWIMQSVVRLERGRHYRSRKCCSVRITCTVAANIFFKCKFENFLMVVSTMCPHIKVAELNTLSDGKGIKCIHIAICQ